MSLMINTFHMNKERKGLCIFTLSSFLFVYLQVCIKENTSSICQILLVFDTLLLCISLLYLFFTMILENQTCTSIQILIKDFLYLGIYLVTLVLLSLLDCSKTLALWQWVPYSTCGFLMLCFFLIQYVLSMLLMCYHTFQQLCDIVKPTSTLS